MVLRFGLLVAVMAMGLWACSGDDEKTNEPVSPDQQAAAAAPSQPGVENAGETPAPAPAAAEPATPAPKPETPPAATAEKAQGTMTVTASLLNVRSGPGMKHKAVRQLKKGETINVLGTEGNWVKIADGEYVSKKFVK